MSKEEDEEENVELEKACKCIISQLLEGISNQRLLQTMLN